MFCSRCGKQIEDGSVRCPYCGEVFQPTYVPQPQGFVQQQNSFQETTDSFVASLKTFFSKDLYAGIARAVSSKTWEGVIYAVIYILAWAFSFPIFFNYLFGTIAGSIAGGSVGKNAGYVAKLVKFGPMFATGLLVGLVSAAVIVLGVYIHTKLLKMQNVSWASLINMVEYATIPVTVVLLANMILALIYAPLCIFTLVGAIIMQVLMLYIGFQKFERLKKSPLLTFAVIATVCAAIIGAVAFSTYKSTVKNSIEDTVGAAIEDSLDDIFR